MASRVSGASASGELQRQAFGGSRDSLDQLGSAGEFAATEHPRATRQLGRLLEALAPQDIEPTIASRVDPEIKHGREAHLLFARVDCDLHTAGGNEGHLEARDRLAHFREVQPLADEPATTAQALERKVDLRRHLVEQRREQLDGGFGRERDFGDVHLGLLSKHEHVAVLMKARSCPLGSTTARTHLDVQSPATDRASSSRSSRVFRVGSPITRSRRACRTRPRRGPGVIPTALRSSPSSARSASSMGSRNAICMACPTSGAIRPSTSGFGWLASLARQRAPVRVMKACVRVLRTLATHRRIRASSGTPDQSAASMSSPKAFRDWASALIQPASAFEKRNARVALAVATSVSPKNSIDSRFSVACFSASVSPPAGRVKWSSAANLSLGASAMEGTRFANAPAARHHSSATLGRSTCSIVFSSSCFTLSGESLARCGAEATMAFHVSGSM